MLVHNKDKAKVIDQELIQEAISKLNNHNKITFINLRELTLSYKNIIKIQNLEGLNSLEKLQLDNNLIRKIEGLSHLTKLKWLDLSFNCIEKIENLEKLTYLTDLSLYHNQIEQVDDISYMKNLSILSLGNNKINQCNQMIRVLKKLENLKVLNISNNPFININDSDYKSYIFVNMKNLVYLDYVYINYSEEKKNITDEEKFKIEEEDDGKKELKNEEEEKKKLEEIYLLDLFTYHDDLINSSTELKSLLELENGFKESTLKFKSSIKKTIEKLKEELQEPIEEESKRKQQFNEALYELIKESELKSNNILKKYYNLKKRANKIIEENADNYDEYFKDIKIQLKLLEENLIRVEMQLSNDCLNSHEKLNEKLGSINEKINTIILTQNLKTPPPYIGTFIIAFDEECKKEVENYHQFKPVNDEDEEKYELIEQILGPIFEVEDRKSTLNSIKDSLENKHSEIKKKISQDLNERVNNYKKNILKEIHDRNRTNIMNIIELIQKENLYWEEILK